MVTPRRVFAALFAAIGTGVVIAAPAHAQSPVSTGTIPASELVTPFEPAFWQPLTHGVRILSPLGDSVPLTCSSFHAQSFDCFQVGPDGHRIEVQERQFYPFQIPGLGSAGSVFGSALSGSSASLHGAGLGWAVGLRYYVADGFPLTGSR